MDEQLEYPEFQSAESILKKMGVDPKTRLDENDQDFEYTSCRLDELDKYLDLYLQTDTSEKEKRVLGCFFLQCLNEYVSSRTKSHLNHVKIMELMYRDIRIHKSELDYWTDTKDPDKDNWWPITQYILQWKST